MSRLFTLPKIHFASQVWSTPPPPPLQEQILAQCVTFTWEYTSTPNIQQFVEINDSGCGAYWVLCHTMIHWISTHDTHTWHSYMTFTNDQTHMPSGVQLLSCGDFPIHDLKQSVQGPEWICTTQFRRRNFDPHHGRRFGRGGGLVFWSGPPRPNGLGNELEWTLLYITARIYVARGQLSDTVVQCLIKHPSPRPHPTPSQAIPFPSPPPPISSGFNIQVRVL